MRRMKCLKPECRLQQLLSAGDNLDLDFCGAFFEEPELFGGFSAQINNPVIDKWTAIIDPDYN